MSSYALFGVKGFWLQEILGTLHPTVDQMVYSSVVYIYITIVVSAVVMLWRGREGGRDGVWDRGRERGMEAREGGKEVGRERARAK